ncbi:MAG: tetratricopeptide repeat protein, partial [Planctomycetes bacterium]|nr:tetratricopeptide repeat protein [Planctomycetota bacterium]
QAIEDYGKTIALDPAFSAAYFDRGNAYGRSGELERAIEDYTRIIQLKPDHYGAYFARGNTFNIYTNGTWIGEFIAGESPPPLIIPEPPEKPAAGAPAATVTAYQEELEEHSEVVAQMRANFAARLAAFREDVPIFERGFIAMVALSESGRTICQFDNTWLWLLDT